jgi:hypothetical protein
VFGILAESFGKRSKPAFLKFLRQRNRQQESDRLRALGGEIGQIHAQDLARDAARRIVGKEMHAGNDAVSREHEVTAGRRRQCGGVIGKSERAGMLGERPEIARDQAVFRRLRIVPHRGSHRLHPHRLYPMLGCDP